MEEGLAPPDIKLLFSVKRSGEGCIIRICTMWLRKGWKSWLNLVKKLVDSCYTEEVRSEIIMSGIKRYYRMRLQQVSNARNL